MDCQDLVHLVNEMSSQPTPEARRAAMASRRAFETGIVHAKFHQLCADFGVEIDFGTYWEASTV
jgi:hypothetical protein